MARLSAIFSTFGYSKWSFILTTTTMVPVQGRLHPQRTEHDTMQLWSVEWTDAALWTRLLPISRIHSRWKGNFFLHFGRLFSWYWTTFSSLWVTFFLILGDFFFTLGDFFLDIGWLFLHFGRLFLHCGRLFSLYWATFSSLWATFYSNHLVTLTCVRIFWQNSCWHLIAPPSTADFWSEVGLNLDLGLITSCCIHQTGC